MSSKEVKRMRDSRFAVTGTFLALRVSSAAAVLCVLRAQYPQAMAAATDHLMVKISTMEARMHALEDALSILQGKNSGKEHPLLLDSSIKTEEELNSTHLQLKPIQESSEEQKIRPKGTLHIDSEAGRSLYFGPGGGSESLLLKAQGTENTPVIEELDASYLPPEIDTGFSNFLLRPSPTLPRTTMQTTIESFLPSFERATYLIGTFLEQLSWMFHIVSRRELAVDLMPVVYKHRPGSYGPHDLALLLITLGIGALVDEELPPYNLEAQHYYKLTQAALSLQTVLVEESVKTIKVLHLMSIYNGMSGKESNIEMCYGLLSLAGQTAMRIGFHVDPSMWGFAGKEAYDRRCYFYNLLVAILWQCLTTGRPPSIWMDAIDCRIPSAEDEDRFQQGEVPLGFGRWGFMASRDLLIPVVQAVLAARPPEYSHILDLDRRITNFVHTNDANPEDTRTSISMRTFVRSHYQALIKMYLHRGYFAEVLMEVPFNPSRSRHKESFTLAYHSACFVLQDTIEQYTKKPVLCGRVWQIWSFAFSAAMIIGAVAVRAPQMPGLDPQPFQKFEDACGLFQTAAETSARAARGLPVLLAMREKALYTFQALRQRQPPGTNPSYDPREELSLFSGLIPLVASKSKGTSPAQGISPSSSSGHNSTVYETTSWLPEAEPAYPVSQSGIPQNAQLDSIGFWPLGYNLDSQPLPNIAQGPENTPFTGYNQPEDVSSYPAVPDGYGMPVLDERWLSAMHGYGLSSYFQR